MEKMKNKNISMDYRLINSTVKFKSVFSLFLGLILSMTTSAQNCQIIDSTNVTDVRCHNGNDGAIDVALLLPGLYTFAWSNGEVTEDILTAEKIVLVISYDIDKTDEGSQADLNALLEQVQAQNIPVYGLSASNYESTDAFKHKHQIMYPYLSGDAIMLKTVIRSNPGIVVLNKGTVTGKWHYNDLPALADLNL